MTNIYTIHLVEIFRDCNFTGHEAKAFSSLLALLFIERNANALYVINDIGVTDIGKNGEVNGVREKKAIKIIDDCIEHTECQRFTIECQVDI